MQGIVPNHGGFVSVISAVNEGTTFISITTQTLSAFGYVVIGAEDGAEAIGLYSRRTTAIDLVLTDMSMPTMDGQALIVKKRLGVFASALNASDNRSPRPLLCSNRWRQSNQITRIPARSNPRHDYSPSKVHP